MKRFLPYLVVIFILVFCNSSWAQCPQDTVDLGICDTLYVQCYDCDSVEGPPPWNIHLLLLVTHDLTVPIDSTKGFVIPLTYNGACSFPTDSNTNDLSGPGLSRSIFRDFGGMENRMLDLEQLGGGQSWDTRTIQIDSLARHFFISLSASGAQDQKWWQGSRVLLATLTLTVTETTGVSIDTTFWPKGSSLSYIRGDGKSYSPRPWSPNGRWFPFCFPVGIKPGDTNSDGHRGLGDIVYLVNYLFRWGPAPRFFWIGDVNTDGVINTADIAYLSNYLCVGGPRPSATCGYYH